MASFSHPTLHLRENTSSSGGCSLRGWARLRELCFMLSPLPTFLDPPTCIYLRERHIKFIPIMLGPPPWRCAVELINNQAPNLTCQSTKRGKGSDTAFKKTGECLF